jgi:hypothetical protein
MNESSIRMFVAEYEIARYVAILIQPTSILNFSVVRNTMANHLIHTRAHAFGELIVIERRRVTLSFHTGFVDNAINLIGRDPHPEGVACNIQDFSSHPTGMAKARFAVQFFLRVNTNVFVTRFVLLFRLGDSGHVIRVVGSGDMGRNLAARTDQCRSETSCKRIVMGPVWLREFDCRWSVLGARDAITSSLRSARVASNKSVPQEEEAIDHRTNSIELTLESQGFACRVGGLSYVGRSSS